jgi:DHA2 family multidrug resistance protein
VAFQTLAPRLRTEATSLFNLIRNLGSSIGVSIVAANLTRSLQINHAELGAYINPYNQNLDHLGLDPGTLASPAGAQTTAIVEQLINQQALLIAYLNDFRLMFWITIAAGPLILLMRYTRMDSGLAGAPQHSPAAAMAD